MCDVLLIPASDLLHIHLCANEAGRINEKVVKSERKKKDLVS